MDLTKLRYFLTLSETGHVREASRKLDISPAALSKAIKSLGEELNEHLIESEGRGIRVTAKGKILAKRLRPLLNEIEELTKRAVKDTCTAISVSFCRSLPAAFASELMSSFYLGDRLYVRNMEEGPAFEAIRNGQLDALLLTKEVASSEFDRLHLGDVKFGCFKRADAGELPLATTLTHASCTEMIFEFCRDGVAAAFLPEFVVRLHNRRAQAGHQLVPASSHPVPPDLQTRTLYLYKLAGEENTPGFRKLARALALSIK